MTAPATPESRSETEQFDTEIKDAVRYEKGLVGKALIALALVALVVLARLLYLA
jgi:hypothetical protein